MLLKIIGSNLSLYPLTSTTNWCQLHCVRTTGWLIHNWPLSLYLLWLLRLLFEPQTHLKIRNVEHEAWRQVGFVHGALEFFHAGYTSLVQGDRYQPQVCHDSSQHIKWTLKRTLVWLEHNAKQTSDVICRKDVNVFCLICVSTISCKYIHIKFYNGTKCVFVFRIRAHLKYKM